LEVAGYGAMANNKRILSSIEKTICDKCVTILRLGDETSQGGSRIGSGRDRFFLEVARAIGVEPQAAVEPREQHVTSGFDGRRGVDAVADREVRSNGRRRRKV
jgi:hypothetical protein